MYVRKKELTQLCAAMEIVAQDCHSTVLSYSLLFYFSIILSFRSSDAK